MIPLRFLLFNKTRSTFSLIGLQFLRKPHVGMYALVAIIWLSCASCTNNQALKTEDVLTLGPILEYEFSPDEQLVAVLLPTDAIEPGSDRYLSIMRSNVGSVGVFIFD